MRHLLLIMRKKKTETTLNVSYFEKKTSLNENISNATLNVI